MTTQKLFHLKVFSFLKKGNTEALFREIFFYASSQMERPRLTQCNGEHLHLHPQLLVLSAVPQGKPNRCTDSSALSLLDISAQASSAMHFQTFIQDNRSEGFLLPNNLCNTLDYWGQLKLYFCYALLYNSFVISTQRNKAIPSHNSLDANVSFQIHPARSSIQKSSSCAAHSSSGQGEHTLAPNFQLLHKHRLQSQLLALSYTSIPTPVTPAYSSVTLSIDNKTANFGCFGYSSKLTSL